MKPAGPIVPAGDCCQSHISGYNDSAENQLPISLCWRGDVPRSHRALVSMSGLGLCLTTLLLGSTLLKSTQAQPPATPRLTKWEYKIVRATEDILNQHGEEGWEVVSGLSDVKGQSAGMRAINTIERAILKRPKSNP